MKTPEVAVIPRNLEFSTGYTQVLHKLCTELSTMGITEAAVWHFKNKMYNGEMNWSV